MDYLYLMFPRHPLEDMKAAVELLKEVHGAKSLGMAPMRMGLLYGTSAPLPEEHKEVLGMVDFI